MLFNFFKKPKLLQIYSPINGQIIPLEEVPDPVFSERLMGEGVAIIPTEGNVYAPVEGTIILIASTKHAIGIQTEDGTEVLIHVGIETVSLDGKGFKMAVNMGDRVSVGQLLMEVDWTYIGTYAKSSITPIVITNSQDNAKQYTTTKEKIGIKGKTVIMAASFQ